MADGTIENIENIKLNDFVMAFNHEAGALTASMVHCVYRAPEQRRALTLHFSDGTMLSIVGGHDLFTLESMKYVTVSEESAPNFIGCHFYNAETKGFVELIDVKYEAEPTDYYSIYTSRNLNCIANGMLSVSDDVDYVLNIYDFDKNLKADPRALAADIERYGLLETYVGFGYTKQDFIDWNMRYFFVVLGKGLITFDSLCNIHNDFLDLLDEGKQLKCAS